MTYGWNELTLNASIVQDIVSLWFRVNRTNRLCVELTNYTSLEPIPEQPFHPLMPRRLHEEVLESEQIDQILQKELSLRVEQTWLWILRTVGSIPICISNNNSTWSMSTISKKTMNRHDNQIGCVRYLSSDGTEMTDAEMLGVETSSFLMQSWLSKSNCTDPVICFPPKDQ